MQLMSCCSQTRDTFCHTILAVHHIFITRPVTVELNANEHLCRIPYADKIISAKPRDGQPKGPCETINPQCLVFCSHFVPSIPFLGWTRSYTSITIGERAKIQACFIPAESAACQPVLLWCDNVNSSTLSTTIIQVWVYRKHRDDYSLVSCSLYNLSFLPNRMIYSSSSSFLSTKSFTPHCTPKFSHIMLFSKDFLAFLALASVGLVAAAPVAQPNVDALPDKVVKARADYGAYGACKTPHS